MNEKTDEQLMQAVSGGDPMAFEELVRRYQSFAWKTAYRFIGDSMEAEDIAQETFFKILESAPRYRPTATFRTYFYRTLTRLCIDRTRRSRFASLEEVPDVAESSASLTDILIENERRTQIYTALASLPPKQRAVIILRHYEGLSYARIAQVLDVTPKAVEGLVSRARASLQAILSNI